MTKRDLEDLSRKKVKRVIDYVSTYCSHTKGQWAGQKFQLIPWQTELIEKGFGTLKPDGKRQYRFIYCEIPKKNGKTELLAALGLYLLTSDGEMGAEVYSAAADKDQAALVYQPMSMMIRNEARLAKRLNVLDSRRRIVDYKTGSFYQVLSAESYTKHGLNPHGVLFDELHAQPNGELWEVLTSGTDYAREQQLIIVATTAGVYDPTSIWWKVRERAIKIANGLIIDPTFLPILYIANKEKDDPEDERIWIRNNPSIDYIFTLDKIRNDFNIAKQDPTNYNNFLRFRLNIPVASITRWIMPEDWKKGSGKIDELELVGRVCYAGLDLSSTRDLSALALVFPPIEDDEPYKVLVRFFIPEEQMMLRSHRDSVPYLEWVQQGYITATPGNVIDYSFIITQILKDTEKFDLKELALDPWNSTKLVQDLQNEGFEKPADNEFAPRQIIEIRQGPASMSGPTKETEKLILSSQLCHGDNPVLAWMANNVVVIKDSNENVKPDKSKSTERIDGIVAMIMGVGRAVINAGISSVYEEQGVMMI